MISIVDYGMGNLLSVQKGLSYVGMESIITSNKDELLKSRGIILPGVGAFPDAMDNLRKTGIDKILIQAAEMKKPLMGICLGMQLLFEESEEVRKCKGLGLLPGKIVKLKGKVKIPHMGWNSLKLINPVGLLDGIKEESYVYFVHSYYAEIEDKSIINAESFYGVEVPAVVSKENIFGMQFHPEKSGEIGIKMLKNFGELVK